jgi:uncharacterized protein HemY
VGGNRFGLALRLQAWTNVALKAGMVVVLASMMASGGLLVLAPPGVLAHAGVDHAIHSAALFVRWQIVFSVIVLILLGFERIIARFAISRAYEAEPKNRRATDQLTKSVLEPDAKVESSATAQPVVKLTTEIQSKE